MMNITIDEAIKAMSLFRDTAPENGYVASCYNMAISALKTIQDGNYTIEPENVSRETLEVISSYDCISNNIPCENCNFNSDEIGCISGQCKTLLHRKEIETWITTHYQN